MDTREHADTDSSHLDHHYPDIRFREEGDDVLKVEIPVIDVPFWHRLLPFKTERQKVVQQGKKHLQHHGHWPAYVDGQMLGMRCARCMYDDLD